MTEHVMCDCGARVIDLKDHQRRSKSHLKWLKENIPARFRPPDTTLLEKYSPSLVDVVKRREQLRSKMKPLRLELVEVQDIVMEGIKEMRDSCKHLVKGEGYLASRKCTIRGIGQISVTQCEYCILHFEHFEPTEAK